MAISVREAIRILWLSPIYWRLDLRARRELIHEYRAALAACTNVH